MLNVEPRKKKAFLIGQKGGNVAACVMNANYIPPPLPPTKKKNDYTKEYLYVASGNLSLIGSDW